jgi:hypothetical protein
VEGTIAKCKISHFTPSSIVFRDGTSLSIDGPITIALATGFRLVAPFLRNLHEGPVTQETKTLTTNGLYIRPLYRNIFPLDSNLPRQSLAFVGLPWLISTAPSIYAQALLIGHVFANDRTLPSTEEMYKELDEYEQRKRAEGWDLWQIGQYATLSGRIACVVSFNPL